VFFSLPKDFQRLIQYFPVGKGGGHLGHESDQLPQSDAMAQSEWIRSLSLVCIHAAHKDRILLAYIFQVSSFSSLGHVCLFMLLIIVAYILW
jgi:hypothetical protein